ncbi:MAG: uridine kinase [Planctomycetes bacterium]|nr:uridine kinase [Planctomycetota bacterium]
MRQVVQVLGIAGGSGSGKTRFTAELVAALPPGTGRILDHDSYYHDLSHLPPPVRAATNFDDPAALDSALLAVHLTELRCGRTIEKPCYDFETHCRRSAGERIEPAPVLIVEGILVLASAELAPLLDLRIFVETRADERLLRRIDRDVRERGRTVDSVLAQYRRTVRPMHERYVEPSRLDADIVIHGEGELGPAVALVADALRYRLATLD